MQAPVPCNECRGLRKLCLRQLPECDRCVKRGAVCVYRNTGGVNPNTLANAPSQSTSSVLPSSAQPTPPTSISLSATADLNSMMKALTQTVSLMERALSSAAAQSPQSGSSSSASRPRLAVACSACRSSRRKCDAMRPSCSRCLEKGTPCEYNASRNVSDTQPEVPSTDSIRAFIAQTPTLIRKLASLQAQAEHYLKHSPAAESVTTADEEIDFSTSTSMELDPLEAMPTMIDWVIASQFLTSLEFCSDLMVNSKEFIETFFTQPADLSLPEEICLGYYTRAHRALVKSISEPSMKTLQALLIISSFTCVKGQPVLARRFFYGAVRMVSELRLDIDPDTLEAMTGVQYTEDEKLERRLLFYIVQSNLKIIKVIRGPSAFLATASHTQPSFASSFVEIHSHQVKPPCNPFTNQVYDIYYRSELQDILYQASKYHKIGPYPVSDILANSTCQNLDELLIAFKMRLPPYLYIESAVQLFQSSNATTATDITSSITMTITYCSAVCLLNRPKLYLTGYLPLDSIFLTGSNQESVGVLLTALDASLSAARNLAQINSWMIHMCPVHFRAFLWRDRCFLFFSLFEAAVVLWFTTTRTLPFWWRTANNPGLLTMSATDRQSIQSEMRDILQALVEIETGFPSTQHDPGQTEYRFVPSGTENMATPLVKCMQGMLYEMEIAGEAAQAMDTEDVTAATTRPKGTELFENSLECGITLGMKVMSLVKEEHADCVGVGVTITEPFTSEPWVYLGLLGLRVNGMSWLAHYEDEWEITTLQDTQTKLKEVVSERNRIKETVESERSLKSRCNELEREVSELKSQLQEKDREGRVVVGEVERCAGFVREVYELLDDCAGAFQIRSQVEGGGQVADHGNSGIGYAGTSVDTTTPGNLDRRYSSAASSLGKYHSPTSPSVGLMALVNAATSFSGGVAILQARNHSSNSHSGGIGLGVNPVPVLVILSNLRTDEREIRRRLRELQDDIRCQALELAGLQDELAMAAAMGSDGGAGGGHLDGLLSGSNYEGASGHLSPNTANGMVFGSPSASSGPSHSAISGGGAVIRSLTLPLIEELSATKKEVHRLNAELEEATDANAQARKDIMAWSDKYDALQLELPEKDAVIQDLKNALARIEAEKTELFEANEEHSMKLKHGTDAITALQSEKLVLEEKLGEMAKLIQDLETTKLHAVTELAARHNEWTTTSNTLESRIHSLQIRLEEQEATYKFKHAEHENEIAEWHKAAASHSAEHSNLQGKISSLEREVSKGLLALRQKEADMESLEGVCEKLRIVLGREKGRITNLKEKVEDWSLVCKMAMECLTLRFDALGRVGDTLARLNGFISTFAMFGTDLNDPSSLDAVDEDSPLRLKQLLHESYRRALQVTSSLSNSASNDGDLDSLRDAKMPILELRETYLHMIGLVDSIDVSGWADCVVESVHRWKELLVSQSLKNSMPSRISNKIAFSGFKIGDLALFLPTRNPKAWAAFNVNAPHYFLSISSAETLFSEQIKNRDWILGIITVIDRRQAPPRSKGTKGRPTRDAESAAEVDPNPFGLASGTSYFWCD
ncbi:oligomeric, coiled-coil, peripheral membrane protein, partial [Chytriomyces hyalinus]